MKDVLIGLFLFYSFTLCAQENFPVPSTESQIMTTLQSAPELYKDAAKVVGYNPKEKLVTLYAESNEMACLVSSLRKENSSATSK